MEAFKVGALAMEPARRDRDRSRSGQIDPRNRGNAPLSGHCLDNRVGHADLSKHDSIIPVARNRVARAVERYRVLAAMCPADRQFLVGRLAGLGGDKSPMAILFKWLNHEIFGQARHPYLLRCNENEGRTNIMKSQGGRIVASFGR